MNTCSRLVTQSFIIVIIVYLSFVVYIYSISYFSTQSLLLQNIIHSWHLPTPLQHIIIKQRCTVVCVVTHAEVVVKVCCTMLLVVLHLCDNRTMLYSRLVVVVLLLLLYILVIDVYSSLVYVLPLLQEYMFSIHGICLHLCST